MIFTFALLEYHLLIEHIVPWDLIAVIYAMGATKIVLLFWYRLKTKSLGGMYPCLCLIPRSLKKSLPVLFALLVVAQVDLASATGWPQSLLSLLHLTAAHEDHCRGMCAGIGASIDVLVLFQLCPHLCQTCHANTSRLKPIRNRIYRKGGINNVLSIIANSIPRPAA